MENTVCPFRIGNGYDVHCIAAGRQMKLCGVTVCPDLGFVAHSDGDVAIHALCDALLGALALGDIGHHFPDSSKEWEGIDSRILLRKVVSLVGKKGWKVGNIDITIALQSPKIGKFISKMRETLAEDLCVDADCVSVKATTTEKLGFVGRSEGCQVWATALLWRN